MARIPFSKRTSIKAENVDKTVRKNPAVRKRNVTRKRVRVIEHENTEVLTLKKYPVTFPYSKVATDFASLYGTRAYDFKLVAKDDVQNWFLIIAANKKYESSREELVVPIDYALMHVIAQRGERAVVVIPYMDVSVLGVVDGGEVIYAQTVQFSIYGSNLQGFTLSLTNLLDEMRTSKIVPTVAFIASPPETVPMNVLSIFEGLGLSMQVLDSSVIDPATYQGDLSLNPKYAFRNRKSITTFLFTMAQNKRKIINTALSVLVLFFWIYLPSHSIFTVLNTSYINTTYKIEQNIAQIQENKKVFSDMINDIEKKKKAVQTYVATFSNIKVPDIVPVMNVILSNPKVTSVSYTGTGFDISFSADTTQDVDNYFYILLHSGYFTVVQPVTRSSKYAVYNIHVAIEAHK